MKLRITSTIRLYLFIGAIALLLTLAMQPLIPNWFAPFKVKIEKDRRSFPNPCIQYHDFDHDGYSEMAALKYQENIDESAIKIYAYNGGLIDQWTFEERWLPNSMIFGDYDHDGNDEVYVFTKTADSLFLYAIDYQQPSRFILYRKYITRSPKKNKKWNLRPISGVFLDSDGDGYDELVFNVMAGAAAYPRGLYSYSIRKQKLLHQTVKSSAFLANPEKVNINHNAFILMEGSFASSNAEAVTPFSDHSSWLTAFDSRLNFVFPPVEFPFLKSEIIALPFGLQNERIIVLLINKSKVRPFARLMLFNWLGQELKRLDLRGTDWALVQSGKNPKKTILIDKKHQRLYHVSSSLELNNPIQYPIYFNSILFTDLNLDKNLKFELLMRHENRLQIFSADFQRFVQIPIPNFFKGFYNISIKENGEGPDQLYLQCGDEKYFVSYHLNPLYPYRFASHFAWFLFLFLLVYAGVQVYNNFSAYRTTLHSILSNPDRGVMMLTPNGKIKFMNHTIIDQFKLGITEYKERSVFELFAEYPSFINIIQNLLRNPKKIRQDLSINENNAHLKALLYAKPIQVLFGFTHGYYIEINDYSRPIEDDRLKSWSKTVQKMAHDIKAPLSSINLNMATLNLKLADLAPKTYTIIEPELKLILQEINRVKQKTINFLKFTNLERPKPGWVRVEDLIRQTIALFKSYSEQSVHFHLDFSPDVDRIYVDEQQIQMALQAIIENAIDAIRARGAIAITVNKIDAVHDRFNAYVEIDIADTGPGIPQEIRDKIYEPYFTTKKEGTGMGLAIAKKIIQEHHGEISIYSTENFSTIVKIMLPMSNHDAFRQQNETNDKS
ncbi:ATP-binding protein [Calditrichota bacterium LG25]